MKRKSNRPATWLLGCLSALAATGCICGPDNDNLPEPTQPQQEQVAVRYAQTQCADRWGQAQGPQQLVVVAGAYFAQRGLTLNQPQASATGQASVCNACNCPTGLVLEATVSPADLAAVLALGFTKK
ncbi:hypothetical protein ACFST9_03110 [Hymenobacter monticola]|uniref:Lipoprotein n=1 Tax=Hymenobacter monticola TaxID=1705399 RepID=A0ABY4B1M0_9BACT|nr:hypothetical protein [Hymenobacter monticola]UOE33050.1 hypothetical protein MTP16_18215 [Hymenobacter monticola]